MAPTSASGAAFTRRVLATSTLAVRIAASVRADPYAVVGVGLGTVDGPLHGGASFGAERMLAEIGQPCGPPARDQIRRVVPRPPSPA
jgi:citrate synthase